MLRCQRGFLRGFPRGFRRGRCGEHTGIPARQLVCRWVRRS